MYLNYSMQQADLIVKHEYNFQYSVHDTNA